MATIGCKRKINYCPIKGRTFFTRLLKPTHLGSGEGGPLTGPGRQCVDGFCFCRCVVSHCFPGQHLMRHFRVSDPSGVNKEILLFRMLLLLLVARVSAVDHVMEKRSRQEQQAATYTGLPTTNKGPTMDMLLTFRLSPSPPPIQIV